MSETGLELRVNSPTIVSDIDRMDGFTQGFDDISGPDPDGESLCVPPACEPGVNRSSDAGRGQTTTVILGALLNPSRWTHLHSWAARALLMGVVPTEASHIGNRPRTYLRPKAKRPRG